jgi:hypothetical protein
VDVAPAPGEGELGIRRQGLAAEEDDQIVQQGGADLGQRLIVHLPRQIDAVDLGAHGACDLRHLDMTIGRVARTVHGTDPSIAVALATRFME